MSSELERRIVRYRDLRECKNAFIDTRMPGSEEKVNFQVIGGGVVETANKHVHISLPHGFNIGGSRMPPGAVNNQHSHNDSEVFLVHRGQFTFVLGPDGEDGEVVLNEGDVISIPIKIFRGFRNSGDKLGHVVSVLGGDPPEKVTWAPYVFEFAEEHGITLLENGLLLDTGAGERIPEGVRAIPPTQREDLSSYRRLTANDMGRCFISGAALKAAPNSPIANEGVQECPVIGLANPKEPIPEAPLGWAHSHQVRRVRMLPGAVIPMHARLEVEVLFVHAGCVEIEMDGSDVILLEKGDFFTIPVGAFRSWKNTCDASNEIHVVRGGDFPEAPVWK